MWKENITNWNGKNMYALCRSEIFFFKIYLCETHLVFFCFFFFFISFALCTLVAIFRLNLSCQPSLQGNFNDENECSAHHLNFQLKTILFVWSSSSCCFHCVQQWKITTYYMTSKASWRKRQSERDALQPIFHKNICCLYTYVIPSVYFIFFILSFDNNVYQKENSRSLKKFGMFCVFYFVFVGRWVNVSATIKDSYIGREKTTYKA